MRKVKNVTKIAKAQSALKKLKNLQERITIDLMYYSVEILDNFQVEENTDIRNLIPGRLLSRFLNRPISLLISIKKTLIRIIPGLNIRK